MEEKGLAILCLSLKILMHQLLLLYCLLKMMLNVYLPVGKPLISGRHQRWWIISQITLACFLNHFCSRILYFIRNRRATFHILIIVSLLSTHYLDDISFKFLSIFIYYSLRLDIKIDFRIILSLFDLRDRIYQVIIPIEFSIIKSCSIKRWVITWIRRIVRGWLISWTEVSLNVIN